MQTNIEKIQPLQQTRKFWLNYINIRIDTTLKQAESTFLWTFPPES